MLFLAPKKNELLYIERQPKTPQDELEELYLETGSFIFLLSPKSGLLVDIKYFGK